MIIYILGDPIETKMLFRPRKYFKEGRVSRNKTNIYIYMEGFDDIKKMSWNYVIIYVTIHSERYNYMSYC